MQADMPKEAGSPKKSVWNTLEIAKILVSLVMPVAVFWFGVDLKNRDERRVKDEAATKAAAELKQKQRDEALAESIRIGDQERAKQIRQADQRWAEEVQRLEDERAKYQERAEDRRSDLQRQFEGGRQRELDRKREYEARLDALKAINRLIFARQFEIDAYALAVVPELRSDARAISARSSNIDLTKENYAKLAAAWSVEILTNLEGYRPSLTDDQFQRLQGLTTAQLPGLYRDAFRCVEAVEQANAPEIERCGKVEVRVRLVWACNSVMISLLGRAAMPPAERPRFAEDLEKGCYEYR
jgi:hypothetical protein